MTASPNGVGALFESRREYVERRLAAFGAAVADIAELRRCEGLCIYVTGSYGRGDASQHSDLDLFFVVDGPPVPRISKTLVDAALIRLAREMRFPEFSDDARYLEVHGLPEMLAEMGSPKDDALNYFTARLLLLLESRPIWADDVYRTTLAKIVASYFRDYHGHEAALQPVFLLNDIIRFWKTMCLNYEHKRNRRIDDRNKRNASHLRNLKLKFSRMLTCYSTVALLASHRHDLTPESLPPLLVDSPTARLVKAAETADATELAAQILEEYAWFLELTARPKDDLLDWIEDTANRDVAFGRAREFGERMFAFVSKAAEGTDLLRYALI